ncbi:hypothetical protein LUZ60_016054 [Juncus effusus]|nr:hypothetical protein LUZ60_016054 [Juncus effusus]
MGSAVLKAQLNDLMSSMYNTGLLDDQFQQLQMLQDESTPDFVAEVITLFCDDSERIISELTNLLQQQVVDYVKVDAYVHQLKGSSSSVGAKRVTLVCMDFRGFCQEHSKEGCLLALDAIKHEFYELHQKLLAMLQLERQIKAYENQRN